MKPFDQLTSKEKSKRLEKIVLASIENYDIQIKELTFLRVDTNTLFSLDSTDGKKYAVRVSTPGEHSLEDNLNEMIWLDALRETDLNVVRPVPRKDGEYITTVEVEGVPEPRRCTIFDWVSGVHLDEHLTPENYYKLGVLMAKLHSQAEAHTFPPEFQPMKWDQVFYYPDEPVVMFSDEYQHLFSKKDLAVCQEALTRLNKTFHDLYANEETRIPIHGDIHVWNVLYNEGVLYLLDFEDLMSGYPVQDISITLSYYRRRENYPELCAALQEGYSTLREWPVQSEKQLESLIESRSLMFINTATRIYGKEEGVIDALENTTKKYLQGRLGRLEKFLEKYPA